MTAACLDGGNKIKRHSVSSTNPNRGSDVVPVAAPLRGCTAKPSRPRRARAQERAAVAAGLVDGAAPAAVDEKS